MEDNKADELKSLIKYAKPTLVSVDSVSQAEGKVKVSEVDAEIRDILNSILPPREYTRDKKHIYIECVLSTPATRQDVLALQQEMEKRLEQRQAREIGICPIREDIYSQCFDELIRQITINCSQRGLLLVRVRDEIKMSLEAHQKLYESALSYGIRKSLLFNQSKAKLSVAIKEQEDEIQSLEEEIEELAKEIEAMEEDAKVQNEKEKSIHDETIKNLKIKNTRFKEELEKQLSVSA